MKTVHRLKCLLLLNKCYAIYYKDQIVGTSDFVERYKKAFNYAGLNCKYYYFLNKI